MLIVWLCVLVIGTPHFVSEGYTALCVVAALAVYMGERVGYFQNLTLCCGLVLASVTESVHVVNGHIFGRPCYKGSIAIKGGPLLSLSDCVRVAPVECRDFVLVGSLLSTYPVFWTLCQWVKTLYKVVTLCIKLTSFQKNIFAS